MSEQAGVPGAGVVPGENLVVEVAVDLDEGVESVVGERQFGRAGGEGEPVERAQQGRLAGKSLGGRLGVGRGSFAGVVWFGVWCCAGVPL